MPVDRAVHGGVDEDVDASAQSVVPGLGELVAAGRAAQEVRAVGGHAYGRGGAGDGARAFQGVDEGGLTLGRPAVVAAGAGDGGELGSARRIGRARHWGLLRG